MLYLPTERQRGKKQLSTLFHQGNQSTLIRYEGNNAVDKNNLHRFLQSYETTTATYSDVNLIILLGVVLVAQRRLSCWFSLRKPIID